MTQYRPLSPDRLTELMSARTKPQNVLSTETLESRIADVWFSKLYDTNNTLRSTLCTIQLDNGFEVRGESVVLDPENYNQELGEHFAYSDAFRQLWPLFGLLEKERSYQERIASASGHCYSAIQYCHNAIDEYLRPDSKKELQTLLRDLTGRLEDPKLKEAMQHPTTDLDVLSELTVKWGEQKGIFGKSTAAAQLDKTMGELQELKEALASGDREAYIDEAGDVVVTLIMGLTFMQSDLREALGKAYTKISQRKGRMRDGVFVKQSDLDWEAANPGLVFERGGWYFTSLNGAQVGTYPTESAAWDAARQNAKSHA